jgi:hypothetical protein
MTGIPSYSSSVEEEEAEEARSSEEWNSEDSSRALEVHACYAIVRFGCWSADFSR